VGELENKQKRLEAELKKLPSLIVAYSGGVDSAYLAYAAHQALGDRMLAVTALSPSYSERDRREAEECVRRFRVPHEFINTSEILIHPIALTILIAAFSVKTSFSHSLISLPRGAGSPQWLMV